LSQPLPTALDYQFGFKVSETWFYRLFVERALAVLVCLQLQCCFFRPALCSLKRRAGFARTLRSSQIAAALIQALHFKLPWPLDSSLIVSEPSKIQSFEIGTPPDAAQQEGPIVLWTVAHAKEDNFLVANRRARFRRNCHQ